MSMELEMELRTDLNEVAADLRHLVDQRPMRGQIQLVEIDPQAGAQVPLLVQVDGERTVATLAKQTSRLRGLWSCRSRLLRWRG